MQPDMRLTLLPADVGIAEEKLTLDLEEAVGALLPPASSGFG